MSESLIGQYLESQNFAPTTRRARKNWLESWERSIGKPLEEATTADILKLKAEFATHRGRVPLKYAQALKNFYSWLVKVRPGFVDPTAGVEFSAGTEPATKDALELAVMQRILDYAEKQAQVPKTWEGPEFVRGGKCNHDLRRFLWHQALRIGPAYLFRVHELLPYRSCHRVTVVDPEHYRVKCREEGCRFEAEYWQDARDPNAVKVITADPGHVENEKVKDFKFGVTSGGAGKEWTTATFLRKGRVRRNRQTGRTTSEIHWSDPKPLSPTDLHWLRMILLCPPKSTRTADQTLNALGELFDVKLRNSKGEPIALNWHIWAKHSVVTNRKLALEASDPIARDADVSPASLRPYDHVAGKGAEVQRQLGAARKFWEG